MRFANRHGLEIASLDAWHRLGKPAAEHHWKPGRSAYELAADWIERDAIAHVQRLLAAGGLVDTELISAIAEKQTRFDDNPRGPRNHDLLVRARHAGDPLVIAVEGKADEPFDKPLWKWRHDAVRRNPSSGAGKRVDGLTTLFFATTIDSDRSWPPIACLGYQLLSALAGTLADAREDKATRAVLMVQEFVTHETADDKHAVNAEVLDAFVARLGAEPPNRMYTADGWITEPIIVRGDGEWLPDELPVQVAKLVRDLRGGASRATAGDVSNAEPGLRPRMPESGRRLQQARSMLRDQ